MLFQHFNNSTIGEIQGTTNRLIFTIILLYIIIYNNINIIMTIIVVLCILPIVELLNCWKYKFCKEIRKTRTTYRGDKWLLMKNKIFLKSDKWLLFTARQAPRKSAALRRAWTCDAWVTADDAGADCNPATPWISARQTWTWARGSTVGRVQTARKFWFVSPFYIRFIMFAILSRLQVQRY